MESRFPENIRELSKLGISILLVFHFFQLSSVSPANYKWATPDIIIYETIRGWLWDRCILNFCFFIGKQDFIDNTDRQAKYTGLLDAE